MKALKLVFWAIIALLGFLLMQAFFESPKLFAGLSVPVGLLMLGLWWIPRQLARENTARHVQFKEGFNPNLRHDNIALDTARDELWIRDASGEQRYLRRDDLLSWKTAHDAGGSGVCRQRLELDVRDVGRPRWNVLFQRHSDGWFRGSNANAKERDEWFARLRAWQQSVASHPSSVAGASRPDASLPNLHSQYYQARTVDDQQNWLMAFDFACDAEELDPKQAWERLGGDYPGPSDEFVRLGRTYKAPA